MTVDQLRAMLNEIAEQGGGDRELRFTYQENYPLQDNVQGVWQAGDDADDLDDPVYIVSGGQNHESPYGPRRAFYECEVC